MSPWRSFAPFAIVLLLSPSLAGCLDTDTGSGPVVPGDPDGPGLQDDHGDADGSIGANDGPDGSGGGNGANDPTNGTTGNETSDNETTGNGTAPPAVPADGPYAKIHGADLPPGALGDEYILSLSPMRWSKTTLTILIVPPIHHPIGDGPTGVYETRFLRAVEDSITHWKEAIDQYGSDDLRGNIEFDVYVTGRDTFSPADLGTVDIYIGNAPGGVGLGGLAAYPLNPRCVIANFGLPATPYKTVFMISAHELGHCLGMGHPGPYTTGPTGIEEGHDPWFDLMSYSHLNRPPDVDDVRLDCVSNLNLLAVHEAFAPAFGRQAKDPVTITASDYFLTDCADRFLE
jgi:hypothetical protein